MKDLLTVVALICEVLSEVEEFLIRGMVYVIDVSGINGSYLKILPVENAVKIAKNSEKCAAGSE